MNTVINVASILLGLLSVALLFSRRPRLPAAPESDAPELGTPELGTPEPGARFPTVTVIIPARNEETSLPLLLGDLAVQHHRPEEIIVADDASTDRTAEIASGFGVRLLSLQDKPPGWMGKSWACQQAANTSDTELLLFLDADVRLGPDALGRLLTAYAQAASTVSVQPWHRTEKVYEQLSLIVSLMSMAANGSMLPKPRTTGLYGPVILMPREDYETIGGHESVRTSIVDDLALGAGLRRAGLGYKLFIGDPDIAYRMYPDGVKSLFEGWTKNLAAGASRAPLSVVLPVFLFITSLTATPLHLMLAALERNSAETVLFGLFYAIWVIVLAVLARLGGRYQPWAWLFFPVPLLALLWIFTVSLIRWIFRLNVRWKGRSISTRGSV